MSIILDTLRSYAARTNDRQNGTSDTIVHNQRICSGWGYITGTGTTRTLNKAVTFPFEFDDIPIIGTNSLGGNTTHTPTNSGDFPVSTARVSFQANSKSTTGFTAFIGRVSNDGSDPGNFGSGHHWGFEWIAIGTYNEYE